ncbi:C40 family peptidase [Micromonospora sp. RHAY321]|uniref:C40 family peptidase n=1 Tax=Micromonospora sp. RHAY321 TaxID=2944807 RepID=UPI00207C5EA6|nr:C40 family peptidase [Micromonospora sp. RHAY321]MCO1597573.1 C40 family peptidase [Micromonospora sp. RHAY321]
MTVTFASPVHADPPLPNVVPDTGTRPSPAGSVQLPGGQAPTAPAPGGPTASPPANPLAGQILALETEVATLGEQLLLLRQDQTRESLSLQDSERQLRAARDGLQQAQQSVVPAAADALKRAAAVPPGTVGADLNELGDLARAYRGQQDDGDIDDAARELRQAQAVEQVAYTRHRAAVAAEEAARGRYASLETTYKQREAALLTLKRRNADQLATIERQREAAEQRLGADITVSGSIAGKAAHPRALAAVRFALAQLGKPYEWAAEGPNRYDCSGLIWAAYRSKGADYDQLPRVSRDQYNATRSRTVDRNSLLPGDLVFFASGTSWSSIHHMGMYIGNGKMVQAPTTGDVVKVSSVWWSRFFAATRVIQEVPAPNAPPVQPTPKPTQSKPPTPRPTPTPTPTPTPRPTSSTTPRPTPTNTKPGPTETPSPTTTPSATTTSTPSPTQTNGSITATPSPS